jgi:uncharacterized protein YjbI with pentapeptide repeats
LADAQCQGASFSEAQCQGASFKDTQCQGASFESTQCQGAYALKKFYSQELSSRIGKETEFETLQLKGEIAATNTTLSLESFWFSLFCLNALNA